jgi:hypothetical protein
VAAAARARFVLLSSVSEQGLLAVKLLLTRSRLSIPFLAVPHSVLASLRVRQSRRPWAWALELRQILRLPHPEQLHYIALGESIYRNLQMHDPQFAVHFSPIELAWFWKYRETPEPPLEPSTVRFGYFGAANKGGIDLFHRLALKMPQKSHPAEFVLVGYLPSETDALRYGRDIGGVSTAPLSPDEYDARASSVTYLVWAANPDNYRLAASSSFLDALSYVKPGLYLRNDYVEYYFKQMGDIGYLCNSHEEIEDMARSLVAKFPRERYLEQCRNIVRGRSIFEPAIVGNQLRTIVESCEGRISSAGTRPGS